MTDVRMGLKHVILQRVQSLDTPTDYKRITDFSINRILSDGEEKNHKNNTTSADILDLSKTGNVNGFLNFHHNDFERFSYFPNLINPFVNHALNFRTPPRPGCNGEVIRPRVCKYVNATTSVQNCNDCDMFYKNLNFPKYPLYPKDTSSVAAAANVWFGAAAAAQFVNSQEFVENLLVNSVGVKAQVGAVSGVLGKLPVKGNEPCSEDMEDETSFKCTICEKVFGCAETLQSHEKTHKSPRYECLDCGKGFSQLRNYKYHLSVHRGTKEFAAECPECGKTFNDKGYLSSHMKIHRNKKEYECPYCPKSFNQRVAFNMHVRIHTGVKPHKCTECGKRFSRKMLLKQHMRTHSGEKPYQCSVCGKSFADRSNMTLHHRLHSGIKPFNCPICPKAFTKKHHLKTHLNYHTGCKPYVCPHPNCNQAFTQSSNMRTHAKKCQFKPVQYSVISTQLQPVISPPIAPTGMVQPHMVMPQMPFQCSHEKTHKSPRYECLDCGKGFSQLRNYKYHLSVHRGTKEFAAECPECGKTFNDKGYLSSHMKIHRNKKEYECPYCPKSFNQRVAFNMHVRIHTGVKPHKCSECGKRFSRKMLLKQHMRTHSGEKPYQCSVCGKSFADRSNMTLHHRLHSGIKPFNCPICPKAFTKKHHLKTHLNYHTGCKPYVCPHPNCNQAFTQSSNMRTHAKKCQFKPVQYSVISTQLQPAISPPIAPTGMVQPHMVMPQMPFQC